MNQVTLANFPSPGQKVEFDYFGDRTVGTVAAVKLNIVELVVMNGRSAERWVKSWGWLIDRDAVIVQPGLVESGK